MPILAPRGSAHEWLLDSAQMLNDIILPIEVQPVIRRQQASSCHQIRYYRAVHASLPIQAIDSETADTIAIEITLICTAIAPEIFH